MTVLCHRSLRVFLTAPLTLSRSTPLLAQTPVHSQHYRQQRSLFQQRRQHLQQQLDFHRQLCLNQHRHIDEFLKQRQQEFRQQRQQRRDLNRRQFFPQRRIER